MTAFEQIEQIEAAYFSGNPADLELVPDALASVRADLERLQQELADEITRRSRLIEPVWRDKARAAEAELAEARAALTTDAIRGAVARGWCHPENEQKVMDEKLALAVADEVEKLIRAALGSGDPPGEDEPCLAVAKWKSRPREPFLCALPRGHEGSHQTKAESRTGLKTDGPDG